MKNEKAVCHIVLLFSVVIVDRKKIYSPCGTAWENITSAYWQSRLPGILPSVLLLIIIFLHRLRNSVKNACQVQIIRDLFQLLSRINWDPLIHQPVLILNLNICRLPPTDTEYQLSNNKCLKQQILITQHIMSYFKNPMCQCL